MGSLEDLHTLIRLLRKYELPVSPILEYAIKEKEEELCSEKSSTINDLSKEQSVITNKVDGCASMIKGFSDYLSIARSDRTARKYLWYIDIPIRRHICMLVDSNANSIYSFQTIEDAESCIRILNLNEEFVKDDIQYDNELSNALMYYIKYLGKINK